MERQGTGDYTARFGPEYINQAGIFLCTAGEAVYVINNQSFRIGRGHLLIIGPLVRIHRVSRSRDFASVDIMDELSVFYPVINSLIDTVVYLKLRNDPCLLLGEQDICFIMDRGREIQRKQDILAGDLSAEERALVTRMIHLLKQETLLEVLHIYFRRQSVDPHPIDKRETIVYNFVYSLHVHFKTERRVSFYADEANLSVGYFKTIIKDKTGRTPSEWIVLITIEQAKLLLEDTDKSIKEIASELHFPEQFTFRKYFKLHTGMAPREYRLSHRQKQEATAAEAQTQT